MNLVVPLLEPLRPYLEDPEVSEVMVNGPGSVFIEKDGVMRDTHIKGTDWTTGDPCHFLRERMVTISRHTSGDLSKDRPYFDGKLPDGSRISMIIPPLVPEPTLSIRKFSQKLLTIDQLCAGGLMSPEVGTSLIWAVQNKENILISGGTSAGKTTLLNALCDQIPMSDRIVTVDDVTELKLRQTNVVQMQARPAGDVPEVTIRDLVRLAMRLRPDRIIVGEVRGAEATELLKAMNSGHPGSMSTIHADSAFECLDKLADYLYDAGTQKPHDALCRSIGNTIKVVVQMERRAGVRRISEVIRLEGYDSERKEYKFR